MTTKALLHGGCHTVRLCIRVGFWDTLILEGHSPAEFSSTLGKIPLLHPEDLDELLQVCLIRVGAKLCRDPGPSRITVIYRNMLNIRVYLVSCWFNTFSSSLIGCTGRRHETSSSSHRAPVLWGRALWTSQRGIRDKHNVLVSVKNICVIFQPKIILKK